MFVRLPEPNFVGVSRGKENHTRNYQEVDDHSYKVSHCEIHSIPYWDCEDGFLPVASRHQGSLFPYFLSRLAAHEYQLTVLTGV